MKKSLYLPILLLAVAVCAFFGGANKAHAYANPIISWGVNPNKNQTTPTIPDKSQDILQQGNGIFVANTTEKKVYFTFDLGYEAGYTADVLDILNQHNIKAIFFLCGNYLKQEALVNRMLEEGHLVGNHTDKHKDLPTLSPQELNKDIDDFNNKFCSLYPNAKPIRFFRPPQGRFDQNVLSCAKSKGLVTTLWSIAIVDWGKSPINSTLSAQKIADRLHPGAIILSHITNSGTPKMLNLLIDKIAEKGYSIGEASTLQY